MATLNSSNISNGNIVEPNDLLQLYSALTSGGGYDVSISGSLTGSATSSSYASTALSASFAVSSSRTITASFALNAVTASFALNVASPLDVINVIPSGSGLKVMYPIAGFLPCVGNPSSASISINSFSPAPSPTTLGTNIWVTANADQDPIPAISVNYTAGILTFNPSDPAYNGNVVFTGYILQ